MAFEITDFNNTYINRGDFVGRFNIARLDEASATLIYVAYTNESGAYIIMKFETSSTVSTATYYARGKGNSSIFATDWANRASLSYVEYSAIF